MVLLGARIDIPASMAKSKQTLRSLWVEAEQHISDRELAWQTQLTKRVDFEKLTKGRDETVSDALRLLVKGMRNGYLQSVKKFAKVNAPKLVGEAQKANVNQMNNALTDLRYELADERKVKHDALIDPETVAGLWLAGIIGRDVFRKPGLLFGLTVKSRSRQLEPKLPQLH
ncbi:hypothetical protein HZC09_05955 [Candidatus Micrarchaeota archaeon]|nr:hypothetical protein [Candidatus Micrarchaeota archaeon]